MIKWFRNIKKLPFSKDAAAPPINKTGDSAICAFLTAVIVFVRPGPAVTAATPTFPNKMIQNNIVVF